MHFKHLSQGHLGEGYGPNWSTCLIVTVHFCKLFFYFRDDSCNVFDSGKENMDSNNKVIPLCWDDQVQTSGARVLTPRGPTKEKRTIVSGFLVPKFDLHEKNRTEQNRTLVYYSLTSTYIHVKTIIYDRNILV